jgi:hypothetical protein
MRCPSSHAVQPRTARPGHKVPRRSPIPLGTDDFGTNDFGTDDFGTDDFGTNDFGTNDPIGSTTSSARWADPILLGHVAGYSEEAEP